MIDRIVNWIFDFLDWLLDGQDEPDEEPYPSSYHGDW